MHAKRDGVGGYACGRQAVVVDGWPVRDGVACGGGGVCGLVDFGVGGV
jgi:hypothetical protein